MQVTRTTTGNMPIVGSTPTLRQGSNGTAVRELQTILKARGFDPGPVDGAFGPRTAAAVRDFQRAQGITVDAIVGPQTWGRLHAAGTTTTTPTTTTPTTTTPSTRPPSGTGPNLDVFPIVGQDGTTTNARYNIGYDGSWNNFNPDTARQNSDFSLNQTNASHPNGHLGVDIFGPRGQPVVAPVSGEIVACGYTRVGGNRVTIRRGDHYFYLCHLDSIANLRVGQQVTAGTQIGTLGNTGSASGTAPHVHFSIYTGGNYNNTVNPFPYLQAAHEQARRNPNDFF